MNAHFRRAGAFRDKRIAQLERVAQAEVEEARASDMERLLAARDDNEWMRKWMEGDL